MTRLELHIRAVKAGRASAVVRRGSVLQRKCGCGHCRCCLHRECVRASRSRQHEFLREHLLLPEQGKERDIRKVYWHEVMRPGVPIPD